MNLLRRIYFLSLVTFLFSGSPGHAIPGQKSVDTEYIMRQVVLTWQYDEEHAGWFRGGTGFYIHTPHHHTVIITNAHVCAAAVKNKMLVEKLDGELFETTIIKQDNEYDLCAMDAHGATEGLELAPSTYCLQEVVTYGHPKLGPLTTTYSQLCDRTFFARVIGGQSGSPVLQLNTPNVVGVVEARHRDKPIGFVVTLDLLKKFLDNL